MKEIAKKDSLAAKSLEPRYKCCEKLSQKPRKEELVEEVERSRSFIQKIKGNYSDEIDQKIEALEGILDPGKAPEKVVSFVDFDAGTEGRARRGCFLATKLILQRMRVRLSPVVMFSRGTGMKAMIYRIS
ncbi:MAG: hypothetical protein ACTSQY_09590 [Candidatus Odinarchaeia archaeon]